MLEYDFMQTAFEAGTVVAVVAGAVGYFLVLRNLAFAGHALSHVGFAGATGAVLLGVAPFWGLIAFTVGGGIGMGLLGDQLRGRDVAVGIMLSLSLGLGVLFLHL
jgi:zinc/manganese transport system permease protein